MGHNSLVILQAALIPSALAILLPLPASADPVTKPRTRVAASVDHTGLASVPTLRRIERMLSLPADSTLYVRPAVTQLASAKWGAVGTRVSCQVQITINAETGAPGRERLAARVTTLKAQATMLVPRATTSRREHSACLEHAAGELRDRLRRRHGATRVAAR